MEKSIHSWLKEADTRLSPVSETPSLDVQVLMAAQLNQTRSWVLAHPEQKLTDGDVSSLEAMLLQMESSTPLPYITGKGYFYGMEFLVTPDVLIPRPETELLVEQALAWCQTHSTPQLILDVGTGSGCIAIALAAHLPGTCVLAIDKSPAALRIARNNASFHQVTDRVKFILSDLTSALSGEFSLICANLPYIPSGTLSKLPVARTEPKLALDGGEDGLDQIRRLVKDALHITPPDACLLLEIEASQGVAVRTLAKNIFPDAAVSVLKDLADHDRLLKIERSGNND